MPRCCGSEVAPAVGREARANDFPSLIYFSHMNPLVAAHHESAHAVACAVLKLPLQDTGIRIDRIGGGTIFNLHRTPGDLGHTPVDKTEREKSIVMIKAGYIATLKAFPSAPEALGADDRCEEVKLFNEMYPHDRKAWAKADKRLEQESLRLVERQWVAIRALAEALLAKPVTLRSPESLRRWPSSRDSHERWMSGDEIVAVLQRFQLSTIVRKESQGIYHAPDAHPEP